MAVVIVYFSRQVCLELRHSFTVPSRNEFSVLRRSARIYPRLSLEYSHYDAITLITIWFYEMLLSSVRAVSP